MRQTVCTRSARGSKKNVHEAASTSQGYAGRGYTYHDTGQWSFMYDLAIPDMKIVVEHSSEITTVSVRLPVPVHRRRRKRARFVVAQTRNRFVQRKDPRSVSRASAERQQIAHRIQHGAHTHTPTPHKGRLLAGRGPPSAPVLSPLCLHPQATASSRSLLCRLLSNGCHTKETKVPSTRSVRSAGSPAARLASVASHAARRVDGDHPVRRIDCACSAAVSRNL
jgi:hypothetical protein